MEDFTIVDGSPIRERSETYLNLYAELLLKQAPLLNDVLLKHLFVLV